MRLLTEGTPGAQQQAAAALAELTVVDKNRDLVSIASGIGPLIGLLASPVVGTPTAAARVLAHLSREDEAAAESEGAAKLEPEGKEPSYSRASKESRASRESQASTDSEGMRRMASAAVAAVAVVSMAGAAAGGQEMHAMDRGTAARREKISAQDGVTRLIEMLHARGTSSKAWVQLPSIVDHHAADATDTEIREGMQEQAAAALADIAYGSATMQAAILDAGGVSPLLNLIRSGSSHAALEQAARAIWHLCALVNSQAIIVDAGTIPELISLLKTGSVAAQEVACGAISDLAHGAILEEQSRTLRRLSPSSTPVEFRRNDTVREAASMIQQVTATIDEEAAPAAALPERADSPASLGGDDEPKPNLRRRGRRASIGGRAHRRSAHFAVNEQAATPESAASSRLMSIAEAGGIAPLVTCLAAGSSQGLRENAASALWHLALDASNKVAIARANAVAPLVALLDDGTEVAQEHASNTLARLALDNADTQTQIAKYCVALLGVPNAGARRRAAKVIRDIATSNPSSPVVIINAGAISPLVALLGCGLAEVTADGF